MLSGSEILMGIDVGTSALKCVIVNTTGRILDYSLKEYSPATPRFGWVEQDPDTWVNSAQLAIRDVLVKSQFDPRLIAAIGVSGQMHSMVLLDRHLKALQPAILWLDRRSTQQVETIKKRFGNPLLSKWIGNPVMPGTILTSLLWLRDTDPITFSKIAYVLLPKDYVRLWLTGTIATDFSDASSTALLDVGTRKWQLELLDFVGIGVQHLPPLTASTTVVGYLRPDVARITGLTPGISVVCGAGDQESQAVGNGIVHSGLVSSTIGTGGQIFAPIENYQFDQNLRLNVYCHAVPGLWHWLAATLTAGLSLRWLRDQILENTHSYASLADAALTVEPGAEGLVFLPYLAGERTPHMDPYARGVFYGLTLRHTWRHMARAIIEGVIFSLFDGLELIQETGSPIHQVIASGGGTKHPLWLQLQADVFGMDITATGTSEAAAFGAAIFAGVGIRLHPDIASACKQMISRNTSIFTPDPETKERYNKLVPRYRDVYRNLKHRFQNDSYLGEGV